MYISNCRIRYEDFLKGYLFGTPQTFRPYLLNGVAADIFKLIDAGYSEENIYAFYVNKYGKESADKVEKYISEMKRRKIIQKEKPREKCAFFDKKSKNDSEYYFSVPDRVQLEIIKSCNLKCKHCYVPGTEAIASKMELRKIKEIIDKLDQLGVFVVQISGGEPMLHPDIDEIVEYIHSKNMAIQLFTNATLLYEHIRPKFVDSIMEFIISVDGSEEFHDSFRGKEGAYSSTVENVKKLIRLGAKVKISYSLIEENKAFLQETSDFFYRIGVSSFVCSVPAPVGNAKNFEYNAKKYRELVAFTQEYYDKNRKRFIEAPENLKAIRNLPPEFTCSAGKTLVYINTDYNVYPCPFFSIEKFRVGNFFDIDFMKEWEENKIFKKFREIRMSQISGCENCSECGIWCRAIMYNLLGRLDGIPVYCSKNKEN